MRGLCLIKANISRKGFTLLEVIIVLMVLSVLGGMLAPMTMKFLTDARNETTRAEIEVVHKVIVGDIANGQYGYVGDVGALPASLDDLNANPGIPAYGSAGNANGVGMGWNGPYVNIGGSAGDYQADAWGNNYFFSTGDGLPAGQILSLGADGKQGTNDDLTFPPSAVDVTGDLSITVKVADQNNTQVTQVLDETEVIVDIHFSSSGAEAHATVNYAGGLFTATGLHQGVHAVYIEGKDLTSYDDDTVTANALVSQGMTSMTIFLGTYDLSGP